MPKRIACKYPLVCILSLVISSAVSAASNDLVFKDLFEANSFEGWTPYDALDAGKNAYKWSLEDGVLHARTEKEPRGNWLVSDKHYENFVLRFEVKLMSGNSGLNFRSFLGEEDVEGPQIDIGRKSTGRIYPVLVKNGRFTGKYLTGPHEQMQAGFRQQDWNSVEIAVNGRHIVVYLNGVKVTDYQLSSKKEKGFLAWQMHSRQIMEFYVRNAKIAEID